MKHFIGALDQGTTGTRFIIFDGSGVVIAHAQKEHRQIHPKPGWVEHDPVEIWQNTQCVIEEALLGADLSARNLAAIGITNQRCTTVAWDRSGRPLSNAIVWQDTRTQAYVDELAKNGGPGRYRPLTGLPIAPAFSGQHMRWMLQNDPSIRTAADSGDLLFGTIDSWLMWNLLGQHVTDVTNASLTQLMNLKQLDWDPIMLDTFGVPRETLPSISSSSAHHGVARGILAGVPVGGILGDQQAALVGHACFRPGDVKNTYGTGSVVVMNTGDQPVLSTAGLMTTVAYRLDNRPACYSLEGPIAATGSLVQWLRDNMGIIQSSAEIEHLAATVPDNGGVYIVPAFSGLYAPYWRFDIQGIITGLTHFSNRGHMARAALEAAAYQTCEVIEVMQREAALNIPTLTVDGGMTRNSLLMQFQSDVLGVPVERPDVLETTALGAAYAAGLAVGFWSGTDEIAQHRSVGKQWRPAMTPERRAELLVSWRRAIAKSLS